MLTSRELNKEQSFANVHIERRHDHSKQESHRQRVMTAQPRVDASPARPSQAYPHIRQNLKRNMIENQRRQAIDNENMVGCKLVAHVNSTKRIRSLTSLPVGSCPAPQILLAKMRTIFSVGTVASNSGAPRPVEVEPRSLNQERRRRDLERITRENLGIAQRIRSRGSNYSVEAMLTQRQTTEGILRRISRHGQRRTDYFLSTSLTGSFAATSSTASSVGGRSATWTRCATAATPPPPPPPPPPPQRHARCASRRTHGRGVVPRARAPRFRLGAHALLPMRARGERRSAPSPATRARALACIDARRKLTAGCTLALAALVARTRDDTTSAARSSGTPIPRPRRLKALEPSAIDLSTYPSYQLLSSASSPQLSTFGRDEGAMAQYGDQLRAGPSGASRTALQMREELRSYGTVNCDDLRPMPVALAPAGAARPSVVRTASSASGAVACSGALSAPTLLLAADEGVQPMHPTTSAAMLPLEAALPGLAPSSAAPALATPHQAPALAPSVAPATPSQLPARSSSEAAPSVESSGEDDAADSRPCAAPSMEPKAPEPPTTPVAAEPAAAPEAAEPAAPPPAAEPAAVPVGAPPVAAAAPVAAPAPASFPHPGPPDAPDDDAVGTDVNAPSAATHQCEGTVAPTEAGDGPTCTLTLPLAVPDGHLQLALTVDLA